MFYGQLCLFCYNFQLVQQQPSYLREKLEVTFHSCSCSQPTTNHPASPIGFWTLAFLCITNTTDVFQLHLPFMTNCSSLPELVQVSFSKKPLVVDPPCASHTMCSTYISELPYGFPTILSAL